LVWITFFLARLGRSESLSTYGPTQDLLWEARALPFGSSLSSLWLGCMLTCYLVIIPALLLSHCYEDEHPVVMDGIVTLAGGILYIISGSATVNFYKILESSPSFPRPAGLAMGSFSILAGVSMLLHFLCFLCLFIKSEVTVGKLINTKDGNKPTTEEHAKDNAFKPTMKTIIQIPGQNDKELEGENEPNNRTAQNNNQIKIKRREMVTEGIDTPRYKDSFEDVPLEQQIYVPSANMFAL